MTPGAGGSLQAGAAPRRPARATGPGGLRRGVMTFAILFAAACQTSGGASKKDLAAQGPSPQAQRQFEDSVRSVEDARTLGVYDWDLLARKFQAVVDEDARHAEAWFNLGVIEEQRKNVDAARKAYERAIAAKPSLFVARENLGVLLDNQGDPAAASEQYKEILRLSPEHAGARARLAELFLEGGDPGRARELAREALLRDPKNRLAQKVLLRVHASRKEWDVARLVAMRALRLDDKDPELPYLLGQVLEGKGEGAAAMAQYQKSYELSGAFLPARGKLAEDALRRHAYEEAAELYLGYTRLAPDDSVAHLNLGTALFGEGKIDEALAAFEKAMELAPDDTRPAFSIAVIYHRHKDEPEVAIDHYRRFLSGSAINLPTSHPVFALMRECEQLIQLNVEMRLAEEAARLQEEKRVRDELEAAAQAAENAKAEEARRGASGEGGGSGRAAEQEPELEAEEERPVSPTPARDPKAEPKPVQRDQKKPPAAQLDEVDPDEPDDEF